METTTLAPIANLSHRIGYARVSSVGQNLDSQLDALQKAGCGKIYSDKMTGSRLDRPGWEKLIEYARPGDSLVVTELSRMTRSLKAERAAAGRASAKARGRSGGRPRTDLTKLQNARVLYENSDKTANEICKTIGIGRRAFFAYLADRKKLEVQQTSAA